MRTVTGPGLPGRDLEVLRPAARPGDLAPATFARRSAAAAIDAAVVLLFLLIESWVLIAIFGLSASRDAAGSADLPYFLVAALFLFFYCAKAESGRHAATLGKRAMHLRVQDTIGGDPGLGRASLRLALRVLTVGTLFLGWLAILFTARRQALHDLLSGTIVVHAGPAQRSDMKGQERR